MLCTWLSRDNRAKLRLDAWSAQRSVKERNVNMWKTSSSYKLSKQLDLAGGTEVEVEGVDKCERFAGGR
jgi:hypothetical protein